MRESRVPHPRGGRFIQLHVWAVNKIGFPAAAVLGLLDFLDRSQERHGQLLASRARIIADLEGIVGKGLVDQALRQLKKLGWIRVEARPIDGNIATRDWYSLDAGAISDVLRGEPVVPISGRRCPGSGPDSGTGFGTPSNKETEEEKKGERPLSFGDLEKSTSKRAYQGGGSPGPLPGDWTLPAEWRHEAAALRPDLPDLDVIAAKFADHCRAVGRVHKDLRAAWRNWVRRERPTTRRGAPSEVGERPADPAARARTQAAVNASAARGQIMALARLLERATGAAADELRRQMERAQGELAALEGQGKSGDSVTTTRENYE